MNATNHAKFWAWVRANAGEAEFDYIGPSPPDLFPTEAPPGSSSKVAAMAARYERGEAMYRKGDETEPLDVGFFARTLGNEQDHRFAMVKETCAGVQVVETWELQKPRNRRPSELVPPTPAFLRKERMRKRRYRARKKRELEG